MPKILIADTLDPYGLDLLAKAGAEIRIVRSPLHEIAVDGRLLGLAMGLALITALVAGAMPAFRMSRTDHAQVMNDRLPGFMRRPAPLSKAIDAIERGIERRSARVWAPRWVGPMLLLRGIAQPLIERNTLRDEAMLLEAIRLAESTAPDLQDPVLGVSAQAISNR